MSIDNHEFRTDRTSGQRWHALRAHHQSIDGTHLRDLFAADPDRGTAMAIESDGLYLDYSKQRVTAETMTLLVEFAHESGLRDGIEAMFGGARINTTEDRAVLHTALRALDADASPTVDGHAVGEQVDRVLHRMSVFAQSVRRGRLRGATSRRIEAVVNIGIGGSDLGPAMACRALAEASTPDIDFRFVSNVDGADLSAALRGLDPETTLFIVSSKTFTTVETLTNAESARQWLIDGIGDRGAVREHFVAVSTNVEAARRFGIAEENVFEFWDWVGGRYSVWSAIGLSLMIAIGSGGFRDFLAGARSMDTEFRTAPFEKNLPVLLGLLGIWNRNLLGAATHAVLPYDERLALLPAYLQQLEMESNGKSVGVDGEPVAIDTAPIVWGAAGTNGQHAFFQLLHQGTTVVPCDFIGVLEPGHLLAGHHDLLIANLIAQTQALAFGRTADEVRAEGVAEHQVPHRAFPGDRPSTTIMMDRLDPYSLGRLLALYEHKVFVQGWLWGIDSFDQWGVELGKVAAGRIVDEIRAEDRTVLPFDSSTAAQIGRYRRARAAAEHDR
ncbi:glucose-6-phosphate isomerase [Gordonia hydrophobica]|uniref:Glucose-6-phosphate isomerase n=1 Tax=Gordonia hydrophobica TaxID=40516 RepID=A0ABZ2U4D6_9ACTN|nr:glucose-6-phosphate isomerase [Gordonia hydrophobica]MBM7368037.1 glucose-6-phosphate isomerase [Gordonia hydrophobica]